MLAPRAGRHPEHELPKAASFIVCLGHSFFSERDV